MGIRIRIRRASEKEPEVVRLQKLAARKQQQGEALSNLLMAQKARINEVEDQLRTLQIMFCLKERCHIRHREMSSTGVDNWVRREALHRYNISGKQYREIYDDSWATMNVMDKVKP